MVINNELQWFCFCIKEDNFDENKEVFSVGASDSEIIGLLYSAMLGIYDYY